MANKKKENIISIDMAKRFAVGDAIENLNVVVSTAGKLSKADEHWEQKLGLTDSSGHIWAIALMEKNIPFVKGTQFFVREATIDEYTNPKNNNQEKRFIINKYEIPTVTADEMVKEQEEKNRFEGVLDPMVEEILRKYDISVIDALWPCKRKGKTNWVIYHRYCEQIAARAGITFNDPEIIENEKDAKGNRSVVLLVKGKMGYAEEWSYGEASPKSLNEFMQAYTFAMAEKRAKDRVILKLAGFHGMVYSETEQNWENENA